MRRLHLIGIGAGDPDHVSVQAVGVMNSVDTFFVIDKGAATASLVALRAEILRRHVTRAHRVVEIADPPRDRNPADYGRAVDDWHRARARAIADAIEAEPATSVGAILVWGDPSLYDSTLRVIGQATAVLADPPEVDVIAGITSVSVLAAEHRTVLNTIGGSVHITTGRTLREQGLPDEVDTAVVMLDSECSFTALPDWEIRWGANLGTPDAVTVAGRVGEVGESIVRERAGVRERVGWVMDTYLLRRPGSDSPIRAERGPRGD